MSNAGSLLCTAERELQARRLEMALEFFALADEAGSDKDRCGSGRWMAYMLRGDFEGAWQENDAMRERKSNDPHRMWRGCPLDGKRVIVRCLHGLGDAVQFLRYVPTLREIASEVTVEVPPRLVKLSTYIDGVDNAITWGENAPHCPPIWDEQIEVMELPYIFRTTLNDLPLRTKYLKVGEWETKGERRSIARLQVGLVWMASEWNMTRSIPIPLLGPLLEIDGCEFWNLQPSESKCDFAELIEDETCQSSVVGLAATISRLDLVITVDTLAAHLAGAMGVPAWVLLQYEADWRWMHKCEDSPWYPSLRLFRQSQPGDWIGAIARVSKALRSERELRKRSMVA